MNKLQKLARCVLFAVVLVSLLVFSSFTTRPIGASFSHGTGENSGSPPIKAVVSSHDPRDLLPLAGPGPGWSHRSAITIDNTGAALTGYQVKIALTSANFVFSVTQSAGEDIRFYDTDDTTSLSYWIEQYDQVGQTATIWVKVPSIPGLSTKTIYMYYGNLTASLMSNGEATFELFDDNWGQVGTGNLNPVHIATQPWWEVDVSFPMVFEDTSVPGNVHPYHMLFDGHHYPGVGNAKGYAWSDDLIHWTEYDNGLIGSSRINPTMGVGYTGTPYEYAWGDTIKVGSTYHMYVSRGPGTTVHAQSTDLIHWTDHLGGTASFDSLTITDPSGIGTGAAVLKQADGITPIVVDGKYWMIYFHGFAAGSMYLAYANTSDLLTWTTSPATPILMPTGWEGGGLWTPSFVQVNDTYYIYYQAGSPFKIGFASAPALSGGNPVRPDGITWTKSPNNPVVTNTHGWDNGFCQDPTLRYFDGTYYLFYTGDPPWTNGFATSTSPEGPWIQYGAGGDGGGGVAWTQGGSPAVSEGVVSLSSGDSIQSPNSYSPGRAFGFRARFYQSSNFYQWGGFINGTLPPFLNIGTLGDSSTTDLVLTTYQTPSGPRYRSFLGTSYFGSFHSYENVWLSSAGRAYIDHSTAPVGSLNSAIPTGPLPIQFRNYNDAAHTLDVDWAYLRQYRDPEPGATVGAPTAVTLASFTAEPAAAKILLTWQTTAEIDLAGFELYRSDAPAGDYVRLNGQLIPPQAPGSPEGAVYHWDDADVDPGRTYYYKLEVVDVHGARTVHGPVSAALARFRIYLPLVLRGQ